jgi:hypothetical protein
MLALGRKTLMLIFGMLTSIVLVGTVVMLLLTRDSCDEVERVLSAGPAGQSILSTFRACTTVGTVVEERVYLTSRDGNREEVFSFVPWDGSGPPAMEPSEPTASWISPREVRISVGTVTQVLRQRSEVDGTKVHFAVLDDRSNGHPKAAP